MDTLTAIATEIADVVRDGARVAVVVAGETFFEACQVRPTASIRVKGDFMGMLAIVMNGLALNKF